MDLNFDCLLDEPAAAAESASATVTLPDAGDPGPLFFDLETVPDSSREELFGLDPLPEVPTETPLADMLSPEEFISAALKDMGDLLKAKNPPEEWLVSVAAAEQASKKPRKGVFDLLADCRGAKGARETALAARVKTCSVTPEFCRIVAIGLAVGDGDVHAILCPTIDEERDALALFWDFVRRVRGPLVGYNILGFDLPVILTRSALLRVVPSKPLGNLRPWDKDAIDLMERRFKTRGAAKLKDLAKWLGLPVDAEGVDGSQVAELARTDPAKLAEYVKSDVALTRRLFKFWSGYFC